MSNSNDSGVSPARRLFLARLAAGAAVLPLLGTQAVAGPLPHLLPDDPAAKALNYTPDAAKMDPKAEPSFKSGSHCGACVLFQGSAATGDFAPCTAFPGKSVNQNGWCRAFSPAA
jgi:hypothetical protein